jgi:pimeloyl-ACP methyl ester carboxylesterase
MDETVNTPEGTASMPADAQPKRYQHKDTTRIVPMQRDHLGRPFWESYLTPEGFQVWAEAQIPPHLPGVIIFVHGVNSEGEWYDVAEKALCEGLNDRLNRNDATKISPNTYSDIGKDGYSRGVRRITTSGHSPVIRFYWGYRAPKGQEKNWLVALRDLQGSDFWAPECTPHKSEDQNQNTPWYWGGGPFQNGTNNLQQLWSEKGFSRSVYGFDLQWLNTEVERQLQDAPPRHYYAHAAQRLAKLIDDIRTECPRDTVTVMSHSQGTMIAMAATALCKTRAPDALFVMNSPFAMDDKITDALTCGSERPTTQARVNTFRDIAKRIKQDKRVYTEEMMQQLQVGATQDMNFWRPDLKLHYGLPERDNHGRLYVYFTPHDRVMGTTVLQSIGWQGIDDELLAELGDTVKQRMLARGTPVGDEPGIRNFGTLPPTPEDRLVPGTKPTDFWNGNRGPLGGVFGLADLWKVPNANQTVTINAEPVPVPLTAEEMKDFEESRKDAPAWGQFDQDEDDPTRGKYRDSTFPFYQSIYQPEEYRTRQDVYKNSGRSRSKESHDEKLERINNYYPEPTNHSTLPMHQEFMRRVAAWDLPIGFCDAYENRNFWARLIKQADWTQSYDLYFETGKLGQVERPSAIDWTTVAEAQSRTNAKQIEWGENYKGGNSNGA